MFRVQGASRPRGIRSRVECDRAVPAVETISRPEKPERLSHLHPFRLQEPGSQFDKRTLHPEPSFAHDSAAD